MKEKNQCKKNLNKKTIANKKKNVNMYFYEHRGGGGEGVFGKIAI